ncbi:MAG: IS256 family transposase [Silvanigrellales bacterium]|nr:IS256 family transposase [Silvanigrellales bacterium]
MTIPILSLVGSEANAPKDLLMEIMREGARKMLVAALEAEVEDFISSCADSRDERGKRLVVRNGHARARDIITPLGPLEVRTPRVHDKRRNEEGKKVSAFSSKILPPYLRKTKSIEDLVPWLYLKGISTSDFPEALQALLGDGVRGFSANTVVRLKQVWEQEFRSWRKESMQGKKFVYLWADGVYFNIRLGEGERQCVLVIVGVREDGTKELVAMEDGVRESRLSWKSLLASLKERGLEAAPEVAVGDGALGFWAALAEEFPQTRIQRCWVHKTANVLNALPKSQQVEAKSELQEIWNSATKADAEKAFAHFEKRYRSRYPKAVDCLAKDRERLLTFYDFPAEHWKHLRTTNPIESTFATVRLRTYRTKGPGNGTAELMMAFKLIQSAARRWRKLSEAVLLKDVIEKVEFVDGIKKAA